MTRLFELLYIMANIISIYYTRTIDISERENWSCHVIMRSNNNNNNNKVLPITGHEGPEGEKRYSSTLS